MDAIRQRVSGNLIYSGELVALILDDNAGPLFLAYPLIERETEVEIFPESLLDDWGHEIASLDLYEWIQENGHQFPRAEIFGLDMRGNRRQCFLRELDLMLRYPCYVYDSKNKPVHEGLRLGAILLPEQGLQDPVRTKPPDDIPKPMIDAQVNWWSVPAGNLDEIDISRLVQ